MVKAFITTYFPNDNVKNNLLSIAKQVDELFVCDNSSNDNSQLFKGIDAVVKFTYVFNGKNLGLSAAYNLVLKNEAYGWSDDDFIIFFDQDSFIEEGHISTLVNEYKSLADKNINIGCLGPVFFNRSNNTVEAPRMKTYLNEHTYSVGSIITSSMLCTYKTLKDISFWNEKVFLDMSDWDLCWRIIASGKKCCMTDLVVLNHALGNGEKKIGPLRLRVGAVVREYYQARESLYLLFRGYTPFKYKIRMLLTLFVRPILHLLFLDNRKKRFKFICKGWRDFFKKHYGAI